MATIASILVNRVSDTGIFKDESDLSRPDLMRSSQRADHHLGLSKS